MTVDHVGIYQVHVAQAFERCVRKVDRPYHIGLIALVGIAEHDALAGKDIVDLAYADYHEALLLKCVEYCLARRLQAVVVTSHRPLIRPFALERSCNYAAYAVLALHDLSGLVADVIELLDRNDVLVSRDLQNAVSARVDDEISGLNVMLAVVPYDICAGIGLVADYPSARSLGQLVQDLLREALVICRERFRRYHARHLPVAYRRVLAAGLLVHAAVAAVDLVLRIIERRTRDVLESELFHDRHVHLAALVAAAESIGSGIAEVSRVRSASDARAVEHYPEYSLAHYSFPSFSFSSAIIMRIASMATRIARSVSCSCGLGRPAFSLS